MFYLAIAFYWVSVGFGFISCNAWAGIFVGLVGWGVLSSIGCKIHFGTYNIFKV